MMFDAKPQAQLQPKRKRGYGPDGLGGMLTFAVLVAAVVFVARDPEFRNAVWTFIRKL